MSDWVRCDTPEQAVEWLDSALDRAADEAFDWLVRESGLDEDARGDAMQKVYAALDDARAHGLRQIAQAFQRLERPALH